MTYDGVQLLLLFYRDHSALGLVSKETGIRLRHLNKAAEKPKILSFREREKLEKFFESETPK